MIDAWSAAEDEWLRKLWAEGLSAAGMAARSPKGRTKNALIGRAHRLGLTARRSPIRPKAGTRAPRRTAAATGPVPAVSPPAQPPRAEPVPAPAPAPVAPPVPVVEAPPAAVAPPVAVRPVAPQRRPRVSPCCYPIGEPGTRGFRFCEVPSGDGSPYCAEHHTLCYVPVDTPLGRDARAAAAAAAAAG